MVQLTYKWHTHQDERTCPVCGLLDGYTWIFQLVTAGELPDRLVHSQFGTVYDLTVDEPRTHGLYSRRGPWNCRCRLSWQAETPELNEKLLTLRQELRQTRSVLEQLFRYFEGIPL